MTNLASRFADEATAGQILITQRLYAEVEDDVEVEPIGEFTLKEFQRPVAAFNVVAMRETAAPSETGGRLRAPHDLSARPRPSRRSARSP